MTIKDMIDWGEFEVINTGSELERKLTKPFCCDLLSIAMGKAPAGGVWVTVMGNINTLAVASLTDIGCIVLAEGATLDEPAKGKAKTEEITIFSTSQPIFEASFAVGQWLNQ